jgi:hypothetical protein
LPFDPLRIACLLPLLGCTVWWAVAAFRSDIKGSIGIQR